MLVRKIDEPTSYAAQSFYTNPAYSYAIDDSSSTTAYLKYPYFYLENAVQTR